MADAASESDDRHNEEVQSIKAALAPSVAEHGASNECGTCGARGEDAPGLAVTKGRTSVAAAPLAAPAVRPPSRRPADDDASNECDTLGLNWSDSPRQGGAGEHDLTSVAVSAITAPPQEKIDTPGLRHGDESRRLEGARDLPIVADDDASNECDTLGLHWSEEPRRGGAGEHDLTSMAVSAITAPAIQAWPRFRQTAAVGEMESPDGVPRSPPVTASDASAHDLTSIAVSSLTDPSSQARPPSRQAVILEDIEAPGHLSRPSTDITTSDAGANDTTSFAVSSITGPSSQARPQSRQCVRVEDMEAPDNSPRPPPVTTSDASANGRTSIAVSSITGASFRARPQPQDIEPPNNWPRSPPPVKTLDAKRYQPMMRPKPTRPISGTCVINEDDHRDGTDARGRRHAGALDLMESGDGSESVEASTYPRLGPGAHHILPSYAVDLEAHQPGHTDRDSMVHITEATLAEEEVHTPEEVIVGTPLEPPEPPLSWWNHRKAKLVFALLCAALFVLSIALLFALSSEAKETIVVKRHRTGTSQPSPPSTASSFPPSPSVSPTSPPSTHYNEGLFETDCESCDLQVAVDGDTAVVARNYDIHTLSSSTQSKFDTVTKYDIHFFSFAHSSFEIATKIDIDYRPTAVTIHRNTVAIGSDYENAVYIYEKDEQGTWTEAMLIQPDEFIRGRDAWRTAVSFGHAIAMNENVIIIGAPGDGEKYQGSVYIYRKNETTWTKEAKLMAPDEADTAAFGYSLSVQGTSLVVGDPGKETGRNGKGAVFGYRFDSLASSWNPVGRTQMEYVCDRYRFFVRLLDDECLLVACRESYSDFTTVFRHEKSEEGDEYVLKEGLRFDSSVESLATDGNAMVVGEFRAGRPLAVRFFVQEKHIWEEVAAINSSLFGLGFGKAVALSGNIALIASDRNVYHTYGNIIK